MLRCDCSPACSFTSRRLRGLAGVGHSSYIVAVVPVRKIANPGGGRKGQGQFVSIRSNGLGFSAEFTRVADLARLDNVEIGVDDEERQILLTFLAEPTDDSYDLLPDGGSGSGGRSIVSEPLMATEWIRPVLHLSAKERRFDPVRKGSQWIVTIPPAFEHRAEGPSDIPSGAMGIYRYLDESGKVLYIGEGIIRDRVNQPYRAEWRFDRIEYSIITGGKKLCEYWEKYWLDRYRAEYGEEPYYNRIGGKARELGSD